MFNLVNGLCRLIGRRYGNGVGGLRVAIDTNRSFVRNGVIGIGRQISTLNDSCLDDKRYYLAAV